MRGGVEAIRSQIADSARTVAGLEASAGTIRAMQACLVRALKAGGRILTAGNGGSAAEAMHMAEELTGRFRGNRRPLAGMALAADGTALTCIANDFGFEEIFSRQVEALGRRGDVLVLFSTSGNSPNLLRACAAARRRGMTVLCLLGKDGGKLKGRGDCELIVRDQSTGRIQEAHQVVMHLLLEGIEAAFPETLPRRKA
jgi:D-sedoheptulose 7-phosphate isomerase